MGFWDIMLLVCVTAMGAAAAYLRAPQHKALLLCFPIPFTLATLALGEDVNATHVAALVVLLLFWVSVYGLHTTLKVPIVIAILLGAAIYCTAGVVLAKAVPKTELAFWVSTAVALILGATLEICLPHRVEPEHRSQMPVWIKVPLLAAIVAGLISMKSVLSGFMTLFPMVGVLTAYEARHSLWTAFRRIPTMMLSTVAMTTTVHTLTSSCGLHGALGIGWIAMALVLGTILSIQKSGLSSGETLPTTPSI